MTSYYEKLALLTPPSPARGTVAQLKVYPENFWNDLESVVPASFGYYVVTSPEFGADPTGVSDSAVAVQAAIAAAIADGGGVVYFPPGTYLLGTRIVVEDNSVHIRGAGQGVTTLRPTVGSDLQSLLHVGYLTGTTQVTDVSVSHMTLLGRSTGTYPGSAPTQDALLYTRSAYRSNFHNLRIGSSTGVGIWETTETSNTGSSKSNTCKYWAITVENCDQGGYRFSGSKNSIYSMLQADNNPSVQTSNAAAHGFLWEAKAFADTGASLPNNDGPMETTQCIVDACKSSDNGGHGFVFDGCAKYVVSNLNSNANTLCGYRWTNNNLAEMDTPALSNGVTSGNWSNLSSRRDGDDQDVHGFDLGGTNLSIVGLNLSNLVCIGGAVSGSGPEGSDRGIGMLLKGSTNESSEVQISNVYIGSTAGHGIVIEKGAEESPLTPADHEAQNIKFSNVALRSIGGAGGNIADRSSSPTAVYGIWMRDSTTKVTFRDVSVWNAKIGTASSKEIRVESGAADNTVWNDVRLTEAYSQGVNLDMAAGADLSAMRMRDWRYNDGDIESVVSKASATTVRAPEGLYAFSLTGTTTVNTITAQSVGTQILFQSAASVTINDRTTSAGNVFLSGAADYAMTAGDILKLTSIGSTGWVEDGRTVV